MLYNRGMKEKKIKDNTGSPKSKVKCKKEVKPTSINLRFRTLVFIWAGVLTIVATLFISSEVHLNKNPESIIIDRSTYYLINITLAFATFLMTSLFSFAILNHNAMTRELNESNRKFPTLQFMTTAFAVADFVDYVLMYQEYPNYVENLKKQLNFNFYMRDEECSLADVKANFDDYQFLTIKMPIKTNNLKPPVSSIRFGQFKFVKDNKMFKFVPCSPQSSALIIFNDTASRNEVMCNLIVKKTSDFFVADALNPFSKMRINVSITSLLGVVLTGWAELYFTNPQKLEDTGANKYKLISSQFKPIGLPSLDSATASSIANLD